MKGIDFYTDPLVVQVTLARYWLSLNAILFFFAMALDIRNLLRFEEWWNWQERMLYRGIFFVMFGATGATLGRALGDERYVSVSPGAPFSTVGLLLVIYALLGNPERFTGQPTVSASREAVE